MRSNDTYAAAAHPYSKDAPHDFGPPMPGSGKMRICRRCGAKETANEKNAACDGLHTEFTQPTQHDYDPIR